MLIIIVCKYIQLEIQCGKKFVGIITQARSRRKLSAPHGQWNRCGSFDDRRTNACCMGPEKPADAISKVLNSENFPCFVWMAPTSQALHRHTHLPWRNNPCYYCNPPEPEPPFQKS